jgi:predicted MFS family arabinose efflux permease
VTDAVTGTRAGIRRPPAGVPAAVRTATTVAVLANSADMFLLFLLLWVAQPQGWTPVQVAVVVLVLRLPTLATGVLCGRCVDRWGARPLVLADLGLRVVLLALLAASVREGRVPLVLVLVLGGLSGAVSPTTYAAVRWLVPRLTRPDARPRANTVVALSDQLPLLVGTALVGPAVALSGPAGGMLVAAAMTAVAFLLALRLPRVPPDRPMPVPAPAAVPGPEPVTGPVPAGGGDVGRPVRVVALISLSTAYYLAYGPFETAGPGYVRDQLGGGEGTYSLLWALFGAGALASLPLAPVLARYRPGVVNAVGALVWGVAMMPLAVIDGPGPAAVAFLVGGLLWGPYTTVETTALQRWVHPSRHGAVFGLQRSLLATATPLGAAAGALALGGLAPATVLLVSAAGCAAAGALALAVGDLRRAR